MAVSKKELSQITDQLVVLYRKGALTAFRTLITEEILTQKLPFPKAEFVGKKLFDELGPRAAVRIANGITPTKLMPAFPISGIILQQLMEEDLDYAFFKAREYILWGNVWYVTDIISERVFGMGLLRHFDRTMLHLPLHQKHPVVWIQRSVGISIHLAVKWGLDAEKSSILLELCENQLDTKTLTVKKGIGWGLETITSFHPAMVNAWLSSKGGKDALPIWAQRKVETGLFKHQKRKDGQLSGKRIQDDPQ